MLSKLSAVILTGTLSTSMLLSPLSVITPQESVPVYRLYNPNTGEHFYTKGEGERDHLISVGWNYEGTGWQAYSTGEPVYRVYNPNAKGGDHYYTKDHNEAKSLVSLGWKWDNEGNPVFYSKGVMALYVAYNPNAQSGAHNYTTSSGEQDHLVKVGWRGEGEAWKVAANGIQEGQPGSRTAKADENVTGPGGTEQSVPGSYRTLYSNKTFEYTPIDGETPVIAFSGEIAISGQGRTDYEDQFVIAGNGPSSGQIGIEIHYQEGHDKLFGQGEINTTIINFPAGAGTNGEQYYSVTTVAPKIKDGQFVKLTVCYYEKGWMTAFVNDQLVGFYKTKLTTPNAYILHNLCNTSNSIRNLKVEKNGKDVTDRGVPSFPCTEGKDLTLINGAY